MLITYGYVLQLSSLSLQWCAFRGKNEALLEYSVLARRAGEVGEGEGVPEVTQLRKHLQGSKVGRPVGLAASELDSQTEQQMGQFVLSYHVLV